MRIKRRDLGAVEGISSVHYLVLAADQMKRAGGVEADHAQAFIHMMADCFAIENDVSGGPGAEVLKTGLDDYEIAACRIVEFALATSTHAVRDGETRKRIWSKALWCLMKYREYLATTGPPKSSSGVEDN
jgi:hypothetical protein